MHLVSVETVGDRDNAGGISGEGPIGKGIHQVERNVHGRASIRNYRCRNQFVDATEDLCGGENLGVDVAQDAD
jgi:hypothetical protein